MRLHVSLAIAAGIAWCAHAQQGEPVRVTARLVEFRENAAWDHFSDGSYASYHLSSFIILTPRDLCGENLGVYHIQLPEIDTPWRQVGKSYEIIVYAERMASLLGQEPAGQRSAFYGTSWTQIIAESTNTNSECTLEEH